MMDEQSIFLAALELGSPGERTTYLNEACGGDTALRKRVDALLTRYDDAGSFLERPPTELEATALLADDTHNKEDGLSDSRTALYDSTDDVPLDLLHPSDKPGCLGTIGKYEVSAVIGRGGMGLVLKAHDPHLERTVAIKVLSPELAANPTAKQRFEREAKAAAAVTNPHVVTIHAVENDRVTYLVMELVDGRTLREKLDVAGMLDLKEILRIGSQIAHGLAAAHKQGLIHRDIKPGNILLENGVERVKITDFGLARAVDDLSVTRTGEVAGTPQFMSPEQAQGDAIDHRSDLFSLGSVMYAMCTGRPPFRGDNAMAVLRRVIDDEPRPIREVNADIPGWLCDIINKLLAKQPQDRYQTAAEVAVLLEEKLRELQYPSTAPKPVTTAPTARKADDKFAMRRRNWLIGAGAGAAIVLLGVIIIKITNPDGTETEIRVPDDSRIEITTDGTNGNGETFADWPTLPPGSSADILTSSDWDWTEPVNLGRVINSSSDDGGPTLTADGLTLVFHSKREGGFGMDDLWISTRDSVEDQWGTPANLGSTVNTVFDETNPSISADGLILVFHSDINSASENNDLWMITRPSRSDAWSAPMNLSDLNSDSFEIGPALSADGLSLVFTSGRSGNSELWESHRAALDAPWSPPRNLGSVINSPAFQGWSELSRDGLSLIFNSNRTGGSPSGPIWITTRPTISDEWSSPVRLQPNETRGARSPCLSGDCTVMLFDSRRPGSQGDGDYDIWITRRVPKNGTASQHDWPADAPAPAIAPFDAEQAARHQQEWADYLGVPVEYENSIGMKFRLIPPGEFLMGSDEREVLDTIGVYESYGHLDWYTMARSQMPRHRVVLTEPLYLGVHEVTQEEFAVVTGNNPSTYTEGGAHEDVVRGLQTSHFPVQNVTWKDAITFCSALSHAEGLAPYYSLREQDFEVANGQGYRLPTEGQWEFACRAGTVTRFWTGDDSESLLQAAWFRANSESHPHSVGGLDANPFGLFDVHGNVREWCEDRYIPDLYSRFRSATDIDPSDPGGLSNDHIARSGPFNTEPEFSGSANRCWHSTRERLFWIGFRVSLSVDGVRQLLNESAGTSWHNWPADAPAPAIAPFDTEQAARHQQEWADYLGVPVEYENSIGMKFRLVPPGEFLMGSTPEQIEAALEMAGDDEAWRERIRSEAPQHQVILTRPIYAAVTEVTQAQYEQVMGTNPSYFSATGEGKDAVANLDTGDHPVEMVSWNDAAEFCAKLSQQEQRVPFDFGADETVTLMAGTGYRLPTEAEWEHVCRAGTTTRYWSGDEDNDLFPVGWFGVNSDGGPHPVGNLKANPFGLFDVHGNVWEWVQDR